REVSFSAVAAKEQASVKRFDQAAQLKSNNSMLEMQVARMLKIRGFKREVHPRRYSASTIWVSTPSNLGSRSSDMKRTDVRGQAFAMPLTSPAYPIGPYRFYHREFMIITYRTDPQKLRALVPEPLEVDEPVVKFEFIRMPDSTGFGDYTESGQVI